ncbi:MAG: hypothetical protein WAU36_14410 [Cyclobacteriaceae bacterium]
MKAILFTLIFSGLLFSANAQTVYKTKTGKKYHTSSHYSASTPISLSEARELGLGPCAVCKPSTTESIQTAPGDVAKPSQPINNVTSTQCKGITQAGARCKRMVKGGSYCYQHSN